MKLHSFRYLVGEGFKNIWANSLMSIASIGVLVACMVLIGLAALISFNVDVAMSNLEQQNIVMVYLNDINSVIYDSPSTSSEATSATSNNTSSKASSSSSSSSSSSKVTSLTPEQQEAVDLGVDYDSYLIHNDSEADAVREKIAALSNVASAETIYRDDALSDLKENYLNGQEEYFTFLDEKYGNPLSYGIRVQLNDLALFDETIYEIEKIPGVWSVVSQSDTAEKIVSIKQGIYVAGAWIIVILLIIALVIVSNTIRVTMYSRKLEISIMKVVGATNSFVRIPFIVEGIILGIISAAISECVVYFCYRVSTETMRTALSTNTIVSFGSVAWILFGIFVAIGTVAGIVGSAIMINKYLRKEGSEFKAL